MDKSNISNSMSIEFKTDVVMDDCTTYKSFNHYELKILRDMMNANPKIDPRITTCSSWKGPYSLPKIGQPEE